MSKWQFDFDQWQKTLESLRTAINKRPDTLREDILRDWHQLKKMLKNMEDNISEISKEEINCRRHDKQTDKHKRLVDTHNQMLTNVKDSLFLFKLLHS